MATDHTMDNWQYDILRQSGWDLWLWVCILASAVLLSYLVFARLWTRGRRGWVAMGLAACGITGTTLVLLVPPLHRPTIGLVWTFLVLGLLSTTFYLNLREQLSARRMGALLAMRLAALALLVPMLFEPVVRYVAQSRPEKPLLFLIDASGSMSFPDVQNGPTRLQSVWQTLRPQLDKINAHFVPRYMTFHTEMQALDKPEELPRLQPDGKATDIVGGIARAMAATDRPDAAVVLISDGIDNVSASVVDAVRGSRRPVHTVWVGSEQAEPTTLANIAVDNVEAPDDFVVGHETKVKVTIKSSALANRVVDVKMSQIDADGKLMGQAAQEKLVLQPLAAGQVVELPYKPGGVGVHRLAVWIDPLAGERSTADNRQEFQGLALDPRIKVLYIEGRARPEYRDLNRALGRDPNIEIASLLRIQQDRFAASGSVDGEPLKQMPQSPDEWKKFDVIILGDLDSSFLAKPQQALIEQRVAEGAGLLMIGGQNSFGPGGYQGSDIEKALPVFVGDTSAAQEKSQFAPLLTTEGVSHPAMEGLLEWFGSESAKASKSLPKIRGNVVVPRPKSGAQVLLTHQDRPGPDGKPQIVLATQLYGKGRSAAFTVDTTYLWYLPLRGMGQDSPYNRLWGQLVRWLAGEDVRNRQLGAGIEGLLSKSVYQLGENVQVRAVVRDERGDATRYAQVSLEYRRPDKQTPQQLPLTPSESRTGLYQATLEHPEKGDWTMELIASKDGRELGRQKLRFTVMPPADEMLKLAADPKLMAGIAEQTQGFSYPLAQLPALLDQLIRQQPQRDAMRQETVPLANTLRTVLALVGRPPQWARRYDLPMQGLLVFGLLAGEWFLRRRWQVP